MPLDLTSLFSLSYSPEMVAVIAVCFLIGGIVKGVLGMGLPAILMISLTLFIPPLEAIPIIVIPMLLVNIFQFYRGPAPVEAARQYKVFAISMAVVMAITAYNIRAFPEAVLLTSIGIAMVLFAIPSLYGWQYTISAHPSWQVLAGAATGVIGGLSSVWSPPVVMYLMGRKVAKDEFIGAVGFIFMIGSVTLALALGAIKLLTIDIFLPALLGFGISLVGFRLGEKIRQNINTELFRKLVLVAFLIMGIRLIVIGVF